MEFISQHLINVLITVFNKLHKEDKTRTQLFINALLRQRRNKSSIFSLDGKTYATK